MLAPHLNALSGAEPSLYATYAFTMRQEAQHSHSNEQRRDFTPKPKQGSWWTPVQTNILHKLGPVHCMEQYEHGLCLDSLLQQYCCVLDSERSEGVDQFTVTAA